MMVLTAGLATGVAQAVTLTFEGVASPGPESAVINVNPDSPYREAGFTLTPSNDQSAVFDASADTKMPGNATDWFGFGESNQPALTLTSGGGAFNLEGLRLGPNSIGSLTASITLQGIQIGGGTLTETFTDLTTATDVSLNWSQLTQVVFIASDDAGLDDLRVTAVPEPGSWALVAVGILLVGGIAGRRSAFLQRVT